MRFPDPARLKIVNYPDPALRKKAADITAFDEPLRKIAGRMLQLMREAKGIGLAAPQVGLAIRLFVCNATGHAGDDLIVINPSFDELIGAEDADEGCLSIPNVTVRVRRAKQAVLSAQALDGTPVKLTGADLLARVWQHETDHLDGRLIIDNMSAPDEISNRRAIQELKDKYQRPRRKKG